MCLINFAYKMDSTYDLVVAANRDEFYHRPTAQAYFWEDVPHVLAGRDLEKMGTMRVPEAKRNLYNIIFTKDGSFISHI